MSNFLTEAAGAYIHIPFCIQKCLYCDFYSVTDLSITDVFLEALASEILSKKSFLKFDSLYIGGGTPSVLSPDQISRITDIMYNQFDFCDSSETTLEINPGTVTLEKLYGYRTAGINRINIGVQSFDDINLKWLGRIHSSFDAQEAILWSKKAGFPKIGIDLIYGLPGQSMDMWLEDLQQTISFAPEHISCYMLTYEKGTPLERLYHEKKSLKPDDGVICEMFLSTISELSNSGYSLYEISNFSKKSYDSIIINRSRHNQKYWTDAPYLGFGPGAHSYMSPVRYWNHRDISGYINDLNKGKIPVAEKETLSLEQELVEMIFLGLRTSDGISIRKFEEKSDKSFIKLFGDILETHEFKEMMEFSHGRLVLTPKGMILHDSIAGLFIERI